MAEEYTENKTDTDATYRYRDRSEENTDTNICLMALTDTDTDIVASIVYCCADADIYTNNRSDTDII